MLDIIFDILGFLVGLAAILCMLFVIGMIIYGISKVLYLLILDFKKGGISRVLGK